MELQGKVTRGHTSCPYDTEVWILSVTFPNGDVLDFGYYEPGVWDDDEKAERDARACLERHIDVMLRGVASMKPKRKRNTK